MNDLPLTTILALWSELAAMYHVEERRIEGLNIPLDRLVMADVDDLSEQSERTAISLTSVLQEFVSFYGVVLRAETSEGRCRIHPNPGRSGSVPPFVSAYVEIVAERIEADRRAEREGSSTDVGGTG